MTQRPFSVPVLLGLAMLLTGAGLAWLAIARYANFQATVFDLGVMSQAIWSVGEGRPLVFTTQGIPLSRLARHVELFYFAVAPLYRLRPDPSTLLVIQAVFYALGAWPLFRLARRRLAHDGGALLVALVYLLYPVGQTAVLFDFHGDVLALPFLLAAVDAADERSWRRYTLWLALALSCKLHVALPVAVLGAVLWWQGERRAGALTAAASVAWGAFAFFAIRGAFAPADAALVKATSGSYLAFYFGELAALPLTLGARLLHLAVVLVPAAPLAWRSPRWLLPALAVVGPVALSTAPGPSFHYRFHHYALAVPFLVLAILHGAVVTRQRPSGRFLWHLPLSLTLLLTLFFNAFFVATPLNPAVWAGLAEQGAAYPLLAPTPRARFKAAWLADHVPPSGAVLADEALGVRLVNRDELYLTNFPRQVRTVDELLPRVDLVVTDALYDVAQLTPDGRLAGGLLYEAPTIARLLNDPEWALTAQQDGLVRFERGGPGLHQAIAPLSDDGAPALHTFGDVAAVTAVDVTPLDDGRYRLQLTWRPLRHLGADPPYAAVTHILGVPHGRIPHLPMMTLLPTPQWQPGQRYVETIEFTPPSGNHALTLTLHDTSRVEAVATDEATQVGEPFSLGTIPVPPP